MFIKFLIFLRDRAVPFFLFQVRCIEDHRIKKHNPLSEQSPANYLYLTFASILQGWYIECQLSIYINYV